MPDWIDTQISVAGDKTTLNEFSSKVKTSETALSLNTLVPMDEKLLEGRGWHAWRTEHWGTKWDVKADVYGDEDTLIYTFRSAGCPPIEWVEHVAPLWPTLQFTLDYEQVEVITHHF
ncbi:hypothetical protein ACFLYO_04895 [Chloroflexota bacterium]